MAESATARIDPATPEPAPARARSSAAPIDKPQPRFAYANFALLAALVALIGVFAAASPYFFSLRNFTNILLSVSVIGTMAAVTTLALVSRTLDLSMGSIVGLAGVIVASGVLRWPWPLAALAAVLAGGVCGAFNGAVSIKLRISPLIMTIGTLSIFRGLTYVVTQGETVAVTDEGLMDLGSGRVFGVPWSVLIVLAVFVVCHLVAAYTRVGRTIYAVGSNPRASRLSGIPLERYRFWVFVASGCAAGLAGVLLTGQAATAVPVAGIGYELLAITAVLLGSTSLHGGQGSIGGTLVGVLIIGVLNNGMTLLGVGSYYQTIANGVLLLAAVALDRFRHTGDPLED